MPRETQFKVTSGEGVMGSGFAFGSNLGSIGVSKPAVEPPPPTPFDAQFAFNPENTYDKTGETGPTGAASAAAAFNDGGTWNAPTPGMLVFDGVVYAGDSGTLVALDASDLTANWITNAPDISIPTPSRVPCIIDTTDHGEVLIYFDSDFADNLEVMAIDISDGTEVYFNDSTGVPSMNLTEQGFQSPLPLGESFFLAGQDGTVSRIDANDGSEIWSVTRGDGDDDAIPYGSFATDGDNLYGGNLGGGNGAPIGPLWSLDVSDGSENWVQAIGENIRWQGFMLYDGNVYGMSPDFPTQFIVTQGGANVAAPGDTGQPVSTTFLSESEEIFGAIWNDGGDARIRGYDTSDATRQWEFNPGIGTKTFANPIVGPVLADGIVYAGWSEGLFACDVSDGSEVIGFGDTPLGDIVALEVGNDSVYANVEDLGGNAFVARWD